MSGYVPCAWAADHRKPIAFVEGNAELPLALRGVRYLCERWRLEDPHVVEGLLCFPKCDPLPKCRLKRKHAIFSTLLGFSGSTFGPLENGLLVCEIVVSGVVLLANYKFRGVGGSVGGGCIALKTFEIWISAPQHNCSALCSKITCSTILISVTTS